MLLSSSRGQGNFRGPEASRPRPRISKCVLEDVLEARDVLEDSTSAKDQKLLLTKEFTHQQPQVRFTSFKKIVKWKTCSYFTLIQKYN